jgi:ribosomal protein S6
MKNLDNDKGEKSVYELGFLILPSIPEDKVPEVVEMIKKVITKEGGVELDAEAPFKHNLAYAMSKTVGVSRYVVNEAYLGWIKFEIEVDKVALIKTGVEKIDSVLRFLLIKAPRKTTFTFAKARAEIEEKEAETIDSVEEEITV